MKTKHEVEAEVLDYLDNNIDNLLERFVADEDICIADRSYPEVFCRDNELTVEKDNWIAYLTIRLSGIPRTAGDGYYEPKEYWYSNIRASVTIEIESEDYDGGIISATPNIRQFERCFEEYIESDLPVLMTY